eukprot:4523298-Karenia_brevis.AAC.1
MAARKQITLCRLNILSQGSTEANHTKRHITIYSFIALNTSSDSCRCPPFLHAEMAAWRLITL